MELAKEAQITFLKENEKMKGRKENEQKEKEKNKIYCKIGLCVSVCLDVVFLTAIIITICYMESERQNDISTKTDICFSCKDIIIHPDDDIYWILRKGKNNETCCMENNKTLHVLVGNFVDRWMKEKFAKDDRHFTRYKCKDASGAENRTLTIKLVGRNEKQTDGNDKVLWNSLSEYAIIPDHEDIVYDEQHGFIEIKKAGIYRIYTQVVLNHDTTTQKWKWEDRPYLNQHYVIRTEAEREKEQVILESSNSYCSCKTDNQTVTSYLGGIFNLSKGDRVAVTVHEKTEIVPIDHMNFFGAYMLS